MGFEYEAQIDRSCHGPPLAEGFFGLSYGREVLQVLLQTSVLDPFVFG